MTSRLDAVVADAVARGLLPADARVRAGGREHRPWPVVVLSGLGAWLAAVPLVAMVELLLGPALRAGPAPYVVGALCLAGAVLVLRAPSVPLFVEQLAVPALLVGLGTLALGLVRDLPSGRAATGLLALLALAIALFVSAEWLRALLGAAAALLGGFALMPGEAGSVQSFGLRQWLGWHLVIGIWLAAQEAQRRGVAGRASAALEPIGAGWIVAGIAALAWSSGQALLLGAVLGPVAGGPFFAVDAAGWPIHAARAASVLLALAGAGWVAWRWAGTRRPALAGVAAVLAALGWPMPALGAALLVLALAATQRRWTLAAVAALAALWTVGAFYYALDWPLATKALVMFAAGALLGALAVASLRAARGSAGAEGVFASASVPRASPSPDLGRAAAWAIAVTAVAVPAVAGFAVWQKEELIAHGESLFVALAPVDPRSLMQGDYMQLEFAMPATLRRRLDRVDTGRRPRVVARRDARGVATIDRLAGDGAPPAADERLIELSPKGGRWIVVTDAWFFREGEAARWQAAKYGEFRVEPGGRALLVGLRGEGLEPL